MKVDPEHARRWMWLLLQTTVMGGFLDDRMRVPRAEFSEMH